MSHAISLHPRVEENANSWLVVTAYEVLRRFAGMCLNLTHDPQHPQGSSPAGRQDGNVPIRLARRQLKLRGCHVLAPHPKINVK
jgi:hypothetical protein